MATRDTQEILLRAATELFYKKGYSGTSIREVGHKAGVSNSLLYHYFKNKEEILFQIIIKTSENLLKTLEEVDQRVADPMECLKEMIVEHAVRFGLRSRKESKIVVEENAWLTGKRKEVMKNYERKLFDLYMKRLKELAATGKMNDLNLVVLDFSLFGIINWFQRWYREEGALSPEEIAQNLLNLVLHGILKDKSE
ncbi:MAG: TetR/AcrR family transcriptional regulator [Syntrophorhabdaceae bacterium]|nr:TetR/AcrR family transcriptional regulator [Syntrophorhabdaceae bacterium]MDD5242500.1 TetR/AcrR family transcriptional regulator [Syntrophorhabdaceae bacterium]